MKTTEELERIAYANGDTTHADLLARIAELEAEVENLESQLEDNKEYHGMNHELKNHLADLYLEFINDFLTTERFAEYLDISVVQCRALIDIGREFHNERVSK